MSRPIIEVENLSKRYRLGQFNARSMREEAEQFFARFRRKEAGERAGVPGDNSEFWALKDVSFSVEPGEVVGIIGRNGAGKSTLLKILSRVTEPTSGIAYIRGRVASLLEVGTGFHPELSGRENIFLNGAILGMSKAEIKAKFDEIVNFSGVEKFLDTPVKRYSSGMYVRLAFAVAAHLEPEVLIVDEILAVGDANFQNKCVGKMQEVSSQAGRTVLFVSHNMAAVEHLCGRVILVDQGRAIADGLPPAVIQEYANRTKRNGSFSGVPLRSAGYARGSITDAWLENSQGSRVTFVPMGAQASFCFQFFCEKSIVRPSLGFGLEKLNGDRIFSMDNYFCGCEIESARCGKAMWTLPDLPLLPGPYQVTVMIYEDNRTCVDRIDGAFQFDVIESNFFGTGRLPDQTQGVIAVRGDVIFTGD